jgi:hypothetical protein
VSLEEPCRHVVRREWGLWHAPREQKE